MFFGAVMMSVGTLFPWYSDIDRFNIGDTFLGITGPLYLAGFVVLATGLSSVYVVVKKLNGRKAAKLPLSEGNFHVLNTSISLLMMILSASVYFHPKFGINIANKQMGFGMIMSFIGLTIFGLFAVMTRKDKVEYANVVSIDEPLFEDKLHMMDHREPGNFEEMAARVETVEEAINAHRENIINETNEIR